VLDATFAAADLITFTRLDEFGLVVVGQRLERPGTSNGPTEAIFGRLEHLRGIALGLRNLTHCTARSLLETGGFGPQLHPRF